LSSPYAPASNTVAASHLADAVRACRRCQAAGHLDIAAPRLLGLERLQGQPPARWPRLVVIGQAPGRHAGRHADPRQSAFVRTIGRWLAQAGFAGDDPRAIAHFTALTRCFPGPSRHGNGDRAPSRAEQALCRDHLLAELALVRPTVVLLVGGLAVTAFGGPVALTNAVGHSWEREGVHYLPLPHPSGASRWRNQPANRAALDRALALLREWRVTLALDGATAQPS
jgi:uracil-DNA glycosylase